MATIAYLDASILVALALGLGDRPYAGAVRMLDAARRAKCRVITSPLAVLEAVGAVRRRAASSHRCRSGSDEERECVDGLVRDAVAHLLDLIEAMKSQDRLTIIELAGWAIDFAATRANMLDHPGCVVIHSRGNPCRYRGLGLIDRLHMAYALAARAVVICTADRAFADVCGSAGEFERMQVQMADAGEAGPIYDLARVMSR